jgi:hypothetical protein
LDAADRSHHSDESRSRKRLRRRMLEIAIFAGMLVIFFVFLHYLTREQAPSGDSSVYSPRYRYNRA